LFGLDTKHANISGLGLSWRLVRRSASRAFGPIYGFSGGGSVFIPSLS
jgi:hypothetical protein